MNTDKQRGIKQIPHAMGSYSTYLASAAARHRHLLAPLASIPVGYGVYKYLKKRPKNEF